jgi:hypothetical protein
MTYRDSLEAAASTSPTLLPTASSSSNTGSSSSSGSLGSTADGGAGRQHVIWQQHVTANSERQLLFRGLRVRMGVATGLVAKGNSIKNSTVYKAAQGM